MSTESNKDFLADVRSFLAQKAKVNVPGRPIPLKKTIAALRPELVDLKDAGYTDADIVELLKEKGIVIGAGTLKNYMSQTRETAGSPELQPRRTALKSPNNGAGSSTHSVSLPANPTPEANNPTDSSGGKLSLTVDPRRRL